MAFKTGVVFPARIQNETAREWISNELLHERDFESNLPPNTFALPLKNLDRLVTTISVYERTSTLTKVPMVSSTTITKSYLSASARRRARSGHRRRGLDGNSVKRADIGGLPGFSKDSRSRISSSSTIFFSHPWPRRKQPGPHFSRILLVSVYGNLILCQPLLSPRG